MGRAEITNGDTTWVVARRRPRRHSNIDDALTAALPTTALGIVEVGQPTARVHADEALCLARFFDKHAHRLTVSCDGTWNFPVNQTESIAPLERAS